MSISPLAKVSPHAKLGARVSIGDFTIIHDQVVLGDDVVVESHCVLGYPTPLSGGEPLVIGDGARIRTHSVFYEGSIFGPGLVTGHRVTVREKFRAGKNLQIGTLCDFLGHAEVGDHVRTHSGVFIPHSTRIGNFVWIFPHVVFTDDPHPPSDGLRSGVTVEDYAAIGAASCLLPGVRVGSRSLVAAHSLVNRDVPADSVVAGVPAKRLCAASEVQLRDGSGPAYPWMRHFHRGYPDDVVRAWMEEYGAQGSDPSPRTP